MAEAAIFQQCQLLSLPGSTRYCSVALFYHKSLSSPPENLKESIICAEQHEKRPDKRNWQQEERSKKTQIRVKSVQLMCKYPSQAACLNTFKMSRLDNLYINSFVWDGSLRLSLIWILLGSEIKIKHFLLLLFC